MLRIAIPRRAIPPLQFAYDLGHLPPEQSQNQLEEVALATVVAALPPKICPIVPAECGFARTTFALAWLSLLGLPELRAHPRGWHAAVAQRGRPVSSV